MTASLCISDINCMGESFLVTAVLGISVLFWNDCQRQSAYGQSIAGAYPQSSSLYQEADQMIEKRNRCFGDGDPLMEDYHDNEWGVPVHDDRLLFEHLMLDCFQAGLSWRTILHKRENFRRALDDFRPEKIAGYGEEDLARLLEDKSIIRNRRKIEATINNAKGFLRIVEEFGSFSDYLWGFCDDRTLRGPGAEDWRDVPASSIESDAMSKDLKARGFQFVGSTVCYGFMQAVGMVDDHLTSCFRYVPR
jgi:DNA-3-methyladenine glycosylase I